MKILIYGVGGIGGYLGSKLLETDFDVSFIARGERLKHLKKNGLEIRSTQGFKIFKPIKVFDSVPKKVNFDIVLSTVKLYDFEEFIKNIKKSYIQNSILLPFQNGIFAEQRLIDEFGEERCYGAVAQISSFVDKDQSIKHLGKLATFFVGKINQKNDAKLQGFCKKCNEVGLDIRYKENIKEKIWEKFIFLSAYSGMTTLTQKTIGEIFEGYELREKFIQAMRETYCLSKEFKVKFNKNPIEFWLEKINKMPYEMTSSMHLDYNKNKKLELKWLSGFVVKYLEKFRKDCVVHKEIINNIKIR
ncbi:MAG: ketopantoate reductase family protein [Alphaproteobacteria bacterium]